MTPTLLLLASLALQTSRVWSADDAPPANKPAEKVDVEGLKNKYWSKGDENEMRVVRNRIFTKAKKFELGAFAGTVSSDPFFDIYSYGGRFAYHFGEYFGFSLMYSKYKVNSSSALKFLEAQLGTTVNSNYPITFMGGEFQYSPLYGKLSLHGAMILYFDLHLLFGGGLTQTEAGRYITPSVGVGQQLYLAKFLALRLDYRLSYFRESILQKADPSLPREVVANRHNFSNTITLGLSFLFGFWD
ncbi:MAG: outer membrane beta-barrel domain-containing protein [Bdellovibrionota bacterium]